MAPDLSSSLIGSPQRGYPGTGVSSGHRPPGKTMNKSAATLTKLSRPQLRGILSRDRLFSVLDELAERVLELYRGPFMPGDEDHPWTISARQQLSTRFLRFIGDLGGYLESNEQFDEALDLYFRGLDADDLAEGLYRRLMLCFQHLGRKAEAIEAYHHCSRTLSARLGVKPSDETTAIYDSLMAAA